MIEADAIAPIAKMERLGSSRRVLRNGHHHHQPAEQQQERVSSSSRKLTRKKSVRMNKSFDDSTSTPKRSGNINKKVVSKRELMSGTSTQRRQLQRGSDLAMSGSSRRSTTPAVALHHERRRNSHSPTPTPRQRTSVQISPVRHPQQSQKRRYNRRSTSPRLSAAPVVVEEDGASNSPRSIRDQILDDFDAADVLVKTNKLPLATTTEEETNDEPAVQPHAACCSWLCTCGEENEGNYFFCGSCGSGKTWQCADCDFENKCKFRFCGMCGIPKKVKSDEEEDDEGKEEEQEEEVVIAPNEWQCQACDMINPCPYMFCSMCGSSKAPNSDELDLLNASFPPPYVTCNPEDSLMDDSLKSFESWSGEQ